MQEKVWESDWERFRSFRMTGEQFGSAVDADIGMINLMASTANGYSDSKLALLAMSHIAAYRVVGESHEATHGQTAISVSRLATLSEMESWLVDLVEAPTAIDANSRI